MSSESARQQLDSVYEPELNHVKAVPTYRGAPVMVESMPMPMLSEASIFDIGKPSLSREETSSSFLLPIAQATKPQPMLLPVVVPTSVPAALASLKPVPVLGQNHFQVSDSPQSVQSQLMSHFADVHIETCKRGDVIACTFAEDNECHILLIAIGEGCTVDVQHIAGCYYAFHDMYTALAAHLGATLKPVDICLPKRLPLPDFDDEVVAPSTFTADDAADLPSLVVLVQSEQLDVQELGFEILAAVAVQESQRPALLEAGALDHAIKTIAAVHQDTMHPTDVALGFAASVVAELMQLPAARTHIVSTGGLRWLLRTAGTNHGPHTAGCRTECLRALRNLCSDASLRQTVLHSGAEVECNNLLRTCSDAAMIEHAAAILQDKSQ